jgi:hypothetical protein
LLNLSCRDVKMNSYGDPSIEIQNFFKKRTIFFFKISNINTMKAGGVSVHFNSSPTIHIPNWHCTSPFFFSFHSVSFLIKKTREIPCILRQLLPFNGIM